MKRSAFAGSLGMQDFAIEGVPYSNSFTVKNMFNLSLRVAVEEAVPPNPSEKDCGVVMDGPPGKVVVALRRGDRSPG